MNRWLTFCLFWSRWVPFIFCAVGYIGILVGTLFKMLWNHYYSSYRQYSKKDPKTIRCGCWLDTSLTWPVLYHLIGEAQCCVLPYKYMHHYFHIDPLGPGLTKWTLMCLSASGTSVSAFGLAPVVGFSSFFSSFFSNMKGLILNLKLQTS